jgi:Bacterial Ig-like domain (group 3)
VNVFSRWRRSAAALAVAGAAVPLAMAASSPASAGAAAPVRTAITTNYTNTTFLQDDLGLPTSDTSPVIQSVTYDNFQWLLQQPGNFAFLIGDPAEDPNFATEAQEVESTAKTDGVHTVYWFDPNLSGGGLVTSAGTTVGSNHEPNLDIRNPSSVGLVPSSSPASYAVSPATQTAYGNAWDNLIAQYLGDGVSIDLYEPDTESALVKAALVGSSATPVVVNNGTAGSPINVTLSPGTNETYWQGASAATPSSSFNDYGTNAGYSTELSNGSPNVNGGALYDYSSGTAPTDATNPATGSVFFTYNNANTESVSGTPEPQKILNWINLDSETSPANLDGDVTTAIDGAEQNTAGGASGLAAPTEFDWWQSEAGAKENELANNNTALSNAPNAEGGNIPLLTSADDDPASGGWRVDQITYPELVDLLKNGGTSANAVILFGGTWCPNTRPVLPFINKYADENNVQVFNFDTVLDGGTTGGGTTSSSDPLQSRNSAASGSTANANPTFLYGDLVSTYLKNIQTQYNPTVGDGSVTYFPAGNTAKALTTVNKLQVPFLIGYQSGSSLNPDAGLGGGVTRQWIDQEADASGLPFYTEYMSDWWYTDPQPNELGIGGGSSGIPTDAPIWSTINSELANVTWQTDPTTLDPNTASVTDDGQYLDSADVGTIKFTPSTGTAASLLPTSGLPGTNGGVSIGSISPSALSSALAGLGASAPASYPAASAALLVAYNANPASTQTAELETVVGAWGVAQARKNALIRAWGNANSPGSVIGAANAVHALDVFFGGLPGGVVSSQTVTANPVVYGTAPKITVAITNQYERVPTSDVSLSVQKAGTTVDTASSAVAQGAAAFTLPVLSPGTYTYTVNYPGDDQILPFTQNGSLTVSPDPTVPGISTDVAQAPTAKVAGSYKVTISTPSGLSMASGTVTAKLTKGSDTKTVTGTLSSGVVTFSVPQLAAGTWTVTIAWAGDANYAAASWTGASIDVPRVKPDKVRGVVSKAPTVKAAGKYVVTIATPRGFSSATGKVTLRVKKGKTTKVISGKLRDGAVIVKVPKLALGTWKVAISWAGDTNYLAAAATGPSIKVRKKK